MPQKRKREFKAEHGEKRKETQHRNEKTQTGLPEEVTAVFKIGRNGIPYLLLRTNNPENQAILDIPANLTQGILHGDTVKVSLIPGRTPKVTKLEIIKRARTGIVGTLQRKGQTFRLIPDDERIHLTLMVIDGKEGAGTVGDKVYGEIVRFEQTLAYIEIKKVLGKPGEHNAEMIAFALERGFDIEYPKDALAEAEKFTQDDIAREASTRRDFRTTPTFTIDPADAKDFDDALSFKKIDEDTYELGIHIADVSYYVREKTALDREAAKRGTSVYLVDRTIPMLPERLSNELCILRPDEDRLTVSSVFHITKSGEVKEEWYGKTIIRSQKRFSYSEAQEILDKGTGIFHAELLLIQDLAKVLEKERQNNGALIMDSEEVKFVLDEHGVPLRVIVKERLQTMKLIEECMLLANRKVAEFMTKMGSDRVFVYRIHEPPNPDKIRELLSFLRGLGYKVPPKDTIDPRDLNALVRSVSDKDERSMIQTAVIRSMAKAIYSVNNIGHFGLGFEHYTHFTSPIRRYPDMLVHRLLLSHLDGKKIDESSWHLYDMYARQSSDRERDAQEAEWGSIKYKQVEYMSTRVGNTFDGIVGSVTPMGLFVQERTTRAEGLIKIRELKGGTCTYDEKTRSIRDTKGRIVFKVGEKVRIKVRSTNLARRMIDYELLSV